MRDRSGSGTFPVRWLTEAGVAGFVLVTLVLVTLRPDYDPVRRYVSEYAVGPGGWALRGAFVSLGVASLNLVPAFFGPDRSGGRAAGGALTVWGVSVLVGAAFPVDVQGAALTGTGAVHLAAAGLGFLALFIAMALAARHFRDHRVGLARWTRRFAVLTPLAFVLETTAFATLGWVGVGQWLLFGLAAGWIFLLGRRLT